MVEPRSFDIIVREMIARLRQVLPEANTIPGSVIRETLINIPAAQLALLSDDIASISDAQTVGRATGSDLDRLASNFGLARLAGTQSTGTIELELLNLDAGVTITVPNGTPLLTGDNTGASIEFRIVGAQQFRPTEKDIFEAFARQNRSALERLGIFDIQYLVSVPIEAVVSGSSGNVGALAIRNGNIANVGRIFNLFPTRGGLDSESDSSLRERVSLVFTGNAVGTAEGYRSTALQNPNVIDATVIRPGDPLQTRDGSIFDTDGTLIEEGTGNTVDVFITGEAIETSTETFVFEDKSETGANIDFTNDHTIGFQDIEPGSAGLQPIRSILTLSGSESGSNFIQGTLETDEQENITYVGNFLLLKDSEADNLTLVENNQTNELRIATQLGINNTKWTAVEQLETSDFANSGLGGDRLVFLRRTASITEEAVTRSSTFNGSDRLALTGVATIVSAFRAVPITRESVIISSTDPGFTVFTRHTPISDVQEVRSARLGSIFDFDIVNADTGELNITSRFAPQTGDILQISYTWLQQFVSIIEFDRLGDQIDWIEPETEQPLATDETLLQLTDLSGVTTIGSQPVTPTHLSVGLSSLLERVRYNITLTGDRAKIINNRSATFQDIKNDDLVFRPNSTIGEFTENSQIGRVLKLRNISQGFDYRLLGSQLRTNRYHVGSLVDTSLQPTEFALSNKTNSTIIEVGDRLFFGRRPATRNLSTVDELQSNIFNNPAPVFDPERIVIDQPGRVHLAPTNDPEETAAQLVGGEILSDTTWSGTIELVETTVVQENVTLTIAPNTIVRVRESSALPNSSTNEERIVVTSTDPDDLEARVDSRIALLQKQEEATESVDSSEKLEKIFIVQQANTTVVIDSDDPGSSQTLTINVTEDVVKFDVVNAQWYINDLAVPTEFTTNLETFLTTVVAETGELAGTLVGITVSETVGATTETVYVASRPTVFGFAIAGAVRVANPAADVKAFLIVLDLQPLVTGFVENDFSIISATNQSVALTNFIFEDSRNLIQLRGDSPLITYLVSYSIADLTRIALTIKGQLVVSSTATSSSMVTFQSAAANPKAGDWEGIIFDRSSHSNQITAPGQSSLIFALVKHAITAVSIDRSDVIINSCIIKDCINTGIRVVGTCEEEQLFRDSDWFFANDFFDLVDDGGRARVDIRAAPTGNSFEQFCDGYGTPLPFDPDDVIYGDVDFDDTITTADQTLLQDWVDLTVSPPTFGTEDFARGDLDGNGRLEQNDVNLLAEKIAGTRSTFPVQVTFVYGDVNFSGSFTAEDIEQVRIWTDATRADYDPASIPEFGSPQFIRADVNGDGEITEDDADLMEQKITGQINAFPVEQVVRGDLNFDGVIDLDDRDLMLDWIAATIPMPTRDMPAFTRGDLNGDGVIDAEDISILESFIDGTITSFPADATSTRTVSLPISNSDLESANLTTIDCAPPTLDSSADNGRAVANLEYGIDYTVRVGSVSGPSTDIVNFTFNIDNCPAAIQSPTAGRDFAIEFDPDRGGYVLALYNTPVMQELVNELIFIDAYGYGYGNCDPEIAINPEDVGCLFLNFFRAEDGNLIQNNLIFDIAGTAITLVNANSTIRNNTVHNCRFYGITTVGSYAAVENNILSDYRIAAIRHDDTSLVSAVKNDMFSRFIEETEQAVGIIDTDSLAFAVDSSTTTILIVKNGNKFSRDQLIQIDSEKLIVETIFSNRLTVRRGQLGTVATTHARGTEIKIFETEVIFTITGLDAKRVVLRQTDGFGTILAEKPTVQLLKIDDYTFRASFFVNRRIGFNYRYQFVPSTPTDETEFTGQTKNRLLRSQQFGNAVNDINNSVQDLLDNDSRNYSADPEFTGPEFEDFSLKTSSPANVQQNSVYEDISDPSNTVNRYAGSVNVTSDQQPLVSLPFAGTTFKTTLAPVIFGSAAAEITVTQFTDRTKTLSVLSYDQETLTGTLTAAILISQIGSYLVQYKVPVNLGTSLPPFNSIGTISYVFDEGKNVDFTSIIFNTSGDGGTVIVQYKVTDSQDQLDTTQFSDSLTESPAILIDSETGLPPRGKVIQVQLTLATNDGGFAADGTPLYPILEDLAIRLSPGQDTSRYNVLGLQYQNATDTTIATIQSVDSPTEGILSSTFDVVGEDSRLQVFVEKKSDNFNESILLVESDQLTTGLTTATLFGNATRSLPLPLATDTLQVNFVLIDSSQAETLVFLEDGTQTTTNRFQGIDSITSEIIEDRRIIVPNREQISVSSTNQPESGEGYFVSYDIVSPKEGETLTIDFEFNSAVQTTQSAIEQRKDIVADVLVRAAFQVPVAIEGNVIALAGQDTQTVVTQVTQAIAQNITNISGFGQTLTPSSTISVIQSVSSVSSVTLTRHSKLTETGVNIIELTGRETLILAANQPVITVTAQGQTEVTNVRVI